MCKKDKAPEPTPVSGSLHLKFNHNFNGTAFELNKEYTDDFGNKFTFTRASMYLSKPQLKNSSGNNLQVSNQHYLVHSNTETQYMGHLNPTTIIETTINIGLDAEANNSSPAKYDTDHPLAYQSPSMYWGTSLDYLFVVLEGRVDTDGDGTLDEGYTFHFGTDAYLNTISKGGLSIAIESEKSAYLSVNINYAKFFEGINLSVDNKMHTSPDEVPLTEKFSKNVPKAVSFE
ncbi:MAG: MbnP family protein [Bacteroidia bacterium]